MIGETIKDFTITSQLGRGGMGDVYAAEQRLVKTKVAIKMLQPQISADKAHVDRFFNEAVAVSKIQHAGIVKIFDVGFHQGRAYLVMEFLDGEPLSSRLRRGLPFEATLAIARQVVSILDATHAAGIVHRDLKPDNIFLVPDAELGERVRILDFGIAKLVDVQATAASMSMGTPAYMPPELWMDAATSGPATDVYAFGCVLFELCCGRPPFIVTAIPDACGRHLNEVPPRMRSLRPELPVALDDLVARMLEKEQAARPSTKAIAAAIAAIPTTGAIAATLPQGPAPAPTPAPVTPTAIGHVSVEADQLEREGKWMELVKLLGKQAETGEPAARAALYFKVATIYQDRFANMAEAIKAFESVLAHDPEHRQALDALRTLYEKRRDWEKLLELEKGELGRTAPEKRADKAVDVARLASARVSKPDIQLYWWERVLEHEPDHRQGFTELAKLYEHAERWTDLAELLRRHAETAPGNDDRVAALRKAAAVSGAMLADRDKAIEALVQLLAIEPGDKVAKQALADLRADKQVAWRSLGAGYRVGERSMASLSGSWKVEGSDAGASKDARGSSVSGSSASGASGSSASSASASGASGSSASDSSTSKSQGSSKSQESSTSDPRSSSGTSPAKPSVAAATSSGTSNAPGSKTKVFVGVGLVAALGAGALLVANRGSSSKDGGGSQTTGSQAQDSQTSDSQASGSAKGSQVERPLTVSDAPRLGTPDPFPAPGSPARAEASGLVLSYRVLSKSPTAANFHIVKPGEQLHTDDRLVFEVMTSEPAHVFISQRPKGKLLALLFPNAGIDITNPLPPNTWTRIPSGTRSFRLNDKDVGAETVFFVASRTPPPNLAAAIANEGKPDQGATAVEDQIVAVAMEKRGDCAGRGREIVLDGEDDCKVKTRGIELDDEKQAKRVRGMTMDDVVFVPFSFKHGAKQIVEPAPGPIKVPKEFEASVQLVTQNCADLGRMSAWAKVKCNQCLSKIRSEPTVTNDTFQRVKQCLIDVGATLQCQSDCKDEQCKTACTK